MNEILKFKKGRMIPKHQDGGGIYSASDLVEAGNRAFGLALYYDKRTGDLVQITSKDALTRDGKVKGEVVRTGAEMQSRPYSVFNITGWKTIGPYQGLKKRAITGKTHINEKEEITELNRLNPAGQRGANTGVRTGGRVRGRVTPRVDLYAANFAGMNFTDDEKRIMTEAGFDPTNAKSVQEFILSKASNANLGARGGSGIADGYWGDKSAAAFQALRNQGIFAPKVDALERITAVNTTPVDAPDFGYATNQDYSNGSQFKGLGFNNYQGLLLYAQNSQDLFAKDLRQRFGSRLTDLNYVESQLGISGKYRGGSAGDFGDMARSMQAWKTGVNNEFDKKRADYAQARLAERTDPTNGMVYSSPEMMRKFLNIKVSPEVRFGINKLDFSNMKYNLNFGNTGASTLGNIGTLNAGGLS